jgi:hypothetical protein
MEVKYKSFGSDTWKTLPMQKKGDVFRATIPCDATGIAGTLRVYVRAKDRSGDLLDNWGTKQAPIEFQIAEGVAAEPPAFDGEDPPERCAATGECPPDFPGCPSGKKDACEGRGDKDWGAACDNSVECKCGLLCEEGTCQTAPSCDTDSECSTGACINGKCDIPGGGGAPTGPFKKNWLGLHFAQDFALVGGNNVCDSNLGQKNENYACFYEGTADQPFVHTPYPYRDGIRQGMVLATQRILLSYDRAFLPNLTAGVRVGYAIGGGPPAGQSVRRQQGVPIPERAKGTGGTAFLPFHAEARVVFWFLPLTNKLLRAYAGLGGGMAQVDAKVSIPEYDCTHAGVNTKNPADAVGQSTIYDPDDPPVQNGNELTPFEQCRLGRGYYDYKLYKAVPVDGWKKMGQSFGTVTVGGMIAFKDNMGILVNANIMYLLPATGLVIQPSLGFTMGL